MYTLQFCDCDEAKIITTTTTKQDPYWHLRVMLLSGLIIPIVPASQIKILPPNQRWKRPCEARVILLIKCFPPYFISRKNKQRNIENRTRIDSKLYHRQHYLYSGYLMSVSIRLRMLQVASSRKMKPFSKK